MTSGLQVEVGDRDFWLQFLFYCEQDLKSSWQCYYQGLFQRKSKWQVLKKISSTESMIDQTESWQKKWVNTPLLHIDCFLFSYIKFCKTDQSNTCRIDFKRYSGHLSSFARRRFVKSTSLIAVWEVDEPELAAIMPVVCTALSLAVWVLWLARV